MTVTYATADGTAQSPGDYTSVSGTLSFAAGEVTKPIRASVVGDAVTELDETFLLNLTAPSNATIADGQGTCTILDDDAASLSSHELSHGSNVVADLAAQPGPAADVDYYRIAQAARSSYEVVVDEVSGDLVPLALDRLGADNLTLLQSSQGPGAGPSRSLRWQNTLSAPVVSQHVRVRSGDCDTDCGTDDVYRIRVCETTYTIPRFNNSGTQITMVLLQNPTAGAVSGLVYFWSPQGVLLHTAPFNVGAKGLTVLNTSTVVSLQGQSGSVTVSNDGGYGELRGKAVALEPASGFSFDSPMQARAR